MDLQATHKIERFGGIDNVNPPTERKISSKEFGVIYFQSKIDNMDIANRWSAETRDGYRTITSFGLNTHSLWSDGNTCLFMVGDSMYRLNEDYSTILLMSGFENRRMSYTKAGRSIYFSNGYEIGCYENGVVRALAYATDQYKSTLVPGHFIEFYNNSLFTAVNNVLYCSDPVHVEQYDIRNGLVPFAGRITMVIAVEDGLWVSDSSKVYFFSGNSVFDLQAAQKFDVPAIENSGVMSDAVYFGQAPAKCAVFSTTRGIVAGLSGGTISPLTIDRYHIPESYVATGAHVRIRDGKYQYVLLGADMASGEMASIGVRLPEMDSTIVHGTSWTLPGILIQLTGTTM